MGGIETDELCATLGIAPKTFHAHIQNIKATLGLAREELVLYAVLAGLVAVPPAIARLLPGKTITLTIPESSPESNPPAQ